MESTGFELRFRIASAFAVVVAASALAGCGGNDRAPTVDECSRHAKPATAGTSVNWDGVHFTVPVGWYPVSVCFGTGKSERRPVGFLTTQPPHAQCSPADAAGGPCVPPETQLGDSDVLVVAEQTTSAVLKVRPDTTVAGRPARLTTLAGEGRYGEGRILETDIWLPRHQVLLVTAYLGRSAANERERVVAMLTGARLPSSQ